MSSKAPSGHQKDHQVRQVALVSKFYALLLVTYSLPHKNMESYTFLMRTWTYFPATMTDTSIGRDLLCCCCCQMILKSIKCIQRIWGQWWCHLHHPRGNKASNTYLWFWELWTVSVTVVSNNACWPSVVWAVSKTVKVPAGLAANCTNHINDTNY